MKLGNDMIVVVDQEPTGDEDAYGNAIMAPAYTEVRWCQVTPGTSQEAGDRSVPTISGLTVLAPPSTVIKATSEVIWPATATGGDPAWSGPTYQVVGDPGQWRTALQVHLERLR